VRAKFAEAGTDCEKNDLRLRVRRLRKPRCSMTKGCWTPMRWRGGNFREVLAYSLQAFQAPPSHGFLRRPG